MAIWARNHPLKKKKLASESGISPAPIPRRNPTSNRVRTASPENCYRAVKSKSLREDCVRTNAQWRRKGRTFDGNDLVFPAAASASAAAAGEWREEEDESAQERGKELELWGISGWSRRIEWAAMRNLRRIRSGEGRRTIGTLMEFRPQKSELKVVWNGRKQSELNEWISDLIFPSHGVYNIPI
jgi:hypothetical protein